MAKPTVVDDGGQDEYGEVPPQGPEQEPVETDVEEGLKETIEALEASKPLGEEPAPPAKIEPPDVGQTLQGELEYREESDIEPAQEFGPEAPQTPPEALSADFVPPEVPQLPDPLEPPKTLLEHLQQLQEQAEAVPGAEQVDTGSPAPFDAGGEATGGGGSGVGGGSDDGLRGLMDSDIRNRDTMSQMLIDHARRLDEITERLERSRL